MRLLAPVLLTFICMTACGTSSGGAPRPSTVATETPTTESGEQPPNVLSALPEGKLVVHGNPTFGASYGEETFVIKGGNATKTDLTDASFSIDGQFAVYEDKMPTGGKALVVRRTDGSEVHRITGALGGLLWSPKADVIAYEVGPAVHVWDAASKGEWVFEIPGSARLKAWLAQGTKLLLIIGSGSNPETERYILDVESGATSQILLPADGHIRVGEAWASISPDGRYVAFASYLSTDVMGCYYSCALAIVQPSSGQRCLVKDTVPGHIYPHVSWSPDGRWMEYYSRADRTSGVGELRIFDPEACKDVAVVSNIVLLTDAWSPDGRTLAVTTRDLGNDQLRLELWHEDGREQSVDVAPGIFVWSHNSATIAVEANAVLTMVDAATGKTSAIPFSDRSRNMESPILLWSPSDRYVVIARYAMAEPAYNPRQSETPPAEKPFLLTPRPAYRGSAWMELIDRQTGYVTMLMEEQRQFAPAAWLP